MFAPRVVKVVWRLKVTTPTPGTSRRVTSPPGRWSPTSTALWSCPKMRMVSGRSKRKTRRISFNLKVARRTWTSNGSLATWIYHWWYTYCNWRGVAVWNKGLLNWLIYRKNISPLRNCSLAGWEWTNLCCTECFCNAGKSLFKTHFYSNVVCLCVHKLLLLLLWLVIPCTHLHIPLYELDTKANRANNVNMHLLF